MRKVSVNPAPAYAATLAASTAGRKVVIVRISGGEFSRSNCRKGRNDANADADAEADALAIRNPFDLHNFLVG